ncbi:11017_t:CDS:2 [Acaulospora colombiana]|uniref:11017_t:CDS:1 n=1 Tax=Acaulospora colombiana TaxID=27376 RepID=A0ACA9MQ45_9GLOM|nr:11017_t:CDS:2 [Acaulospora colombiana]
MLSEEIPILCIPREDVQVSEPAIIEHGFPHTSTGARGPVHSHDQQSADNTLLVRDGGRVLVLAVLPAGAL